MRFHCGISFSWRSIKKYLIPILLGFLAFFGFNFLQDNKVIPLGFIQAYALDEESPGESPGESPVESPGESPGDNYEFVYESDNIDHKPLHNKVYWFDNNTTLNGILSSIYILLFLYCISMIFLKVIVIVHNVRWKR